MDEEEQHIGEKGVLPTSYVNTLFVLSVSQRSKCPEVLEVLQLEIELYVDGGQAQDFPFFIFQLRISTPCAEVKVK